MKITLFIPSLVGCGAERVLVNLANYLIEKGHNVCILNYYDNPSSYRLNERVERRFVYRKREKPNIFKKVIPHFLPKLYDKLSERYRLHRLKHFIKESDTDCYLVMLERTILDLLSLRKHVSCPIIASERNYPEKYNPAIKQKLYEMAPLADGYVFQTQDARDCYEDNINNYIIIPNALNSDFLNEEQFNGQRRNVIVNVGRLESQKNQELLIRAFAKAEIPDYTLEIYGEGPLRPFLQNLIESLNLSGKVFLKGHVDNIKDLIRDAQVFVLSSDYEGIPNALLEAMALGLPCVSTDCAGGGARVLINDGIDGLIVAVGNVDKMAAAIKTILNDSAMARTISANAIEKVKMFDAESIYSKWEEFILQTLKGNKSSEI